MKEKRMMNSFQWTALHLQKGRFGFPRANGVDDRKVLFWVTSRDLDMGRELYFVNDSGETLTRVGAEDGGFTSWDEGVISSWTEAGKGYHYRDVRPAEAVKVAEFDDYYDLDYVLSVAVTITSPSRGTLTLSTPLEKGGVRECVLLYDSGEVGKGCSLSRESDCTD